MRTCLTITALAALLIACSPVEEQADDVQAPAGEAELLTLLMELENGAMERWRKGDPGGYLELVGSDYSYFDPSLDRRLDGSEAMADYLEPIRGKIRYEGSTFLNPRVQAFGDAAVLSYNYVSSGENGNGASGQTPWNVTEVYARGTGGWKLVHSHFAYTGAKKPDGLDTPVIGVELMELEDEPLKALLTLENDAMERWRRGDPWGFTELSAPEVTYFDPDVESRIDGLEALTELYRKVEGKIHYDGSTFANPRVQRHGDLAVLTFNYVSSGEGAEGEPPTRTCWNTTEAYARHDDGWKIVHTHWSYVNGAR